MKIKKNINSVRRSIMRSLTKNIGKSSIDLNPEKDIIIKRILISRPNHRLGNLLLLSPLVQEVIDTFPESKIDLFVKGGITPSIYKNYTNIDKITQLPKKPFSNLFQYIKGWTSIRTKRYDLVINASFGSSSGRLSTLFANSKYRLFGDFDENCSSQYSDYGHSAKNSVYNLRDYLSKLGKSENTDKVPSLDLKLDKNEIQKGKEKLLELVKNDKKTICLFTNATGEKCYSESWWTEFYDKLEKAFPEYNIIELLPVENISKLNFKIPSFYSKDIREMGAFIANCVLFIAADNGVMHLASASGTPTVGLFSVTDENAYKPYGNKSFSINTGNVDNEGIIDLLRKTLSHS
ncbi:ADP-heptose:LPS heptosyltransferase [Chryseobacterium ginsenosidimutans]|uniref:glycosyltransferase family 9 protein n=1 Tax=Chryseobacterium ginsenosidimutans TaxID=687846 RepID=UPI0021680E59|nr:glycosyltransferase family 9 protein [Chryseobacterium ginsenosidimutans]MCS3870473.1 ADP-heptose:LPS heptosyltransferase [Chryseobacterium ginsenosidimutans]